MTGKDLAEKKEEKPAKKNEPGKQKLETENSCHAKPNSGPRLKRENYLYFWILIDEICLIDGICISAFCPTPGLKELFILLDSL